MRRRKGGFAAAVLVTAAAYASVPGAPPATAAPPAGACASADGVTVVVDFHDLGGGLQQTCDADGGGKDGASLFLRAGYELTPVQRQPSFVCRVNGVPTDDPCVNTPPADAYWTLWWSDGTDGSWSYSSVAASSLKIPEGGYVAFSWNRGAGQDKPGTSPRAHASPTPTPKPSTKPTPKPSAKPTPTPKPSPSATPQPTPTPVPASEVPSSVTPAPSSSSAPTAKPSSKPSRKPEPSASSTAVPTRVASPTEPEREGEDVVGTATFTEDATAVPTWAVLLVLGGLFAGATATALVRRRRHGTRLGS